MSVIFLLLVVTVMLSAAQAAFPLYGNNTMIFKESTLKSVVPAVTSVDLSSYIGFWYQMYADAIVLDTIEKDSFCDTALYGAPDSQGHVSVLNTAKIGKPTVDGTTYTINGYAYNDDPSQPAELKVKFEAGSNGECSYSFFYFFD